MLLSRRRVEQRFSAKPKLEVRKARILHEYEETDELVDWLRKCLFYLDLYKFYENSHAYETNPFYEKARTDLKLALGALPNNLRPRNLQLNKTAERTLLSFAAASRAWIYHDTIDESGELLGVDLLANEFLFPLGEFAEDAIGLGWWQWRRRNHIKMQLNAMELFP